jgi:Nif-specific regulatory protein
MPPANSAYLVVRRDDGFGEVFPLKAGVRHTLGRSANNRIVLKDELCSREHAEVFQAEGQWQVRDLGSLNGTRLNGQPVRTDAILAPLDELHLGRTQLVFVEDVRQLPSPPPTRGSKRDESLAIKQRLAQTRFEAPTQIIPMPPKAAAPPAAQDPSKTIPSARLRPRERDLALLYKLALEMGAADALRDLVRVVLDGLFAGIPAEVGAVLTVQEGRDLELLAYRNRDAAQQTYHKVSQFVSREVLASKEAVLAENIADNSSLRNRESLGELQVSSLICAPVLFEGAVLGLIHLYRTSPGDGLDADDLDFALAVARQLGVAMHQLSRQESLSAENRALRDQLRLESELVGASAALESIESQIARVAETNATVLIRGESGVGKELVARAVHMSSPRRDGPFVTLNCAALTESLLESELFGHERGAFTGATEKLIGKFEAAHQGTIFLDEIGEMALNTQAKFLRVLEGHPFERIGGNTPIRVDVRVLAATNSPLEEGIRAGKFRRDLFYRLQVVEITVPPLRDRKADVPALAEHFLKRFVRETGRRIRGFTPTAMKKLTDHDWPGNVRELRNAIERAVALGTGPQLDANDIWLSSLDPPTPPAAKFEPVSLDELEKRHILQTLQHTDWNKSQTATILGIERSTLDRKIKGYDLKR